MAKINKSMEGKTVLVKMMHNVSFYPQRIIAVDGDRYFYREENGEARVSDINGFKSIEILEPEEKWGMALFEYRCEGEFIPERVFKNLGEAEEYTKNNRVKLLKFPVKFDAEGWVQKGGRDEFRRGERDKQPK